MGQKIFLERGKFKLVSDDRDIAIPVKQRQKVQEWCRQTDVTAEMPLNRDNRQIVEQYFGVDLWRVKDDQQRLMFALRWA